MDPISATLAVAQLLNMGLSMFAQVKGKAPDPDVAKLIEAGSQVITQALQVNGLIVKAHREGRDITDAELDEVVKGDDAARRVLVDAIARAEGSAKPSAPGA
jgi:hypothetical protein